MWGDVDFITWFLCSNSPCHRIGGGTCVSDYQARGCWHVPSYDWTYTFPVTERTLFWSYNGYLFGQVMTKTGHSFGKNGKKEAAVGLHLWFNFFPVNTFNSFCSGPSCSERKNLCNVVSIGISFGDKVLWEYILDLAQTCWLSHWVMSNQRGTTLQTSDSFR